MLLYKLILERSEEKNPVVDNWRFDCGFVDVEWTPFHAAARYGHLDMCLALMGNYSIIHPEAVNPANAKGLTPLHAAAAGGHLQVCNAILEKLRNHPSLLNPEYGSLTALHFAAEKGHMEVCEAILKVAPIKNPPDDIGNTPLHCAATRGHEKICRMIVYILHQCPKSLS